MHVLARPRERPETERSENRQVGEEEGRERGPSEDEALTERERSSPEVGSDVQHEADPTDDGLQTDDPVRDSNERRLGSQEDDEEEARRECARQAGDPFGPVEEAILRMVEQRHTEVPDESTEREHDDPPPEGR